MNLGARSVARTGPAGGGGRAGGFLQTANAGYKRRKVETYTDACEAPSQFWASGAIPLRTVTRNVEGIPLTTMEKTYEHPMEILPSKLGFSNVGGMYSMGNDDMKQYLAEGPGGRANQLLVPGHPRSFLYRKQSHLLNNYISKIPLWNSKEETLKELSGGRAGLILDGPTGTGKSSLMAQAAHFARSRKVLTLYIPNAHTWTHGEWAWPNVLLPGFFDVPDATRAMFYYFARSHGDILKDWKLVRTPKDLPLDPNETHPTTLLDLCHWAFKTNTASSVDRQSVATKFLLDELEAEKSKPVLFIVDGYNLFSNETHFRYPHPDFLRTMKNLQATDVDMYPQELPRIPSSRLAFVRGLNKMILNPAPNRFFITATTRNFKNFDGGVSGFEQDVTTKEKKRLDEYTPYDAEKDSLFHPVKVDNFDDYEYRSFMRYLVNSGELSGSGWGPLWHFSPTFERKLYKLEFMSERNPQKAIDHFHNEITWHREYARLRQKQYKVQTESRDKAAYVLANKDKWEKERAAGGGRPERRRGGDAPKPGGGTA